MDPIVLRIVMLPKQVMLTFRTIDCHHFYFGVLLFNLVLQVPLNWGTE